MSVVRLYTGNDAAYQVPSSCGPLYDPSMIL